MFTGDGLEVEVLVDDDVADGSDDNFAIGIEGDATEGFLVQVFPALVFGEVLKEWVCHVL